MVRLFSYMARPRVLRALRGSAIRLHAAPPMPGTARGAGIPVLREPFRSGCGQVRLQRHGRRGTLRAAPIPRVIIRRPCAPPVFALPAPRPRGGEIPRGLPLRKGACRPSRNVPGTAGKSPGKKTGKKSEKFLKKNKKSVDTK